MTNENTNIWPIQPHTSCKHELLRKYLNAWFPILSLYPSLFYVDGFCGPGRYSDGEVGSPVIALKAALACSKSIQNANFLFIDKEKMAIENLKNEIGKLNLPEKFKVEFEIGSFPDVFTTKLEKLNERIPVFAFIDPFGYKDLPFSLVSKLLNRESCEVFINFMVESVNRFMNVTEQQIIDLFGTGVCLEIWRKFPNGGSERQIALTSLYEKQLKNCAKHTLKFKMNVQNSRIKYFMIFATNHDKGFKKMKEVMWSNDDTGRFEYSSATHDQLTFMPLFNKSILKDLILKEFSSKKATKASQILNFVLFDTDFLEKHAREVLIELEQDNIIIVNPIKSNGDKRIKGTFPEDVIINFSNS